MPKDIKAVVLAAGLGTRMKSSLPKALHLLHGKPMIDYVLDAVRSAGIDNIICVTGHKSGEVKKFLKNVKIVRQKKPLGSADALKQARPLLKNYKGNVLVLYGDEPLIKTETLKRLINEHKKKDNFCTLLSANMSNPTGYGRIARDDEGEIIKIIEETEASGWEKNIKEINVGVYCFREADRFFSILDLIENDNKKKEYFLTDAISLMNERNFKIDSVLTNDSDEAMGINSKKDLAEAEKIMQKRTIIDFMNLGVTIVDKSSTYIDNGVKIGRNTVIHPHTIIEKDVKIGDSCSIGPFARIRPGCELKDKVEVGNFVELVRTKIGEGTKIKHKTYLGDAVIGRNVNIGAGTITANYDGKGKYATRIDDGAFIGSGTIFVAPVKVGKNSTTGAGAVVTKNHDVPPNSVVVGVPARVVKKKKTGGKR